MLGLEGHHLPAKVGTGLLDLRYHTGVFQLFGLDFFFQTFDFDAFLLHGAI